jgi:hypothetical protein
MKGKRKFLLGILYLVFVFGLGVLAIANGQSVADVGILAVSAATGLGAIVYGNVKEHEASKGS